jgi:hypothetical protein
MSVSELAKARLAGENIADRIGRISTAAEAMLDCGLTQDAIVALLKLQTGCRRMSKQDIVAVLNALPELSQHVVEPDE